MSRTAVLGMTVLLFGMLQACGSTAGECVSTVLVTYDNFGKGFFIENCQSCHASTATDRQGAPEAVVFDAPADIDRHRERIFARALSDTPSMPPGGGVSDQDLDKLHAWLVCNEGV